MKDNKGIENKLREFYNMGERIYVFIGFYFIYYENKFMLKFNGNLFFIDV